MTTKKKTADAGEKARAILKALTRTSEHSQKRIDLSERLTELAPECKNLLIDNLKSPHWLVREACVTSLGEVLEDSAQGSVSAALRSFEAEIDALMPDEPGIGGVRGDSDPTIRLGGVHRLRDKELGSVDHRADVDIPRALAPLIKDPNGRVQSSAINAFMHIVAAGDLVKPILFSFFEKSAIQSTLSHDSLLEDLLGTMNTLKLPKKELLSIYDRLVDLGVDYYFFPTNLMRLGPTSIPTLLKLIRRNPREENAEVCAEVLIDFGSQGRSALKSLLGDEDLDLQLLAAKELINYGGLDLDALRGLVNVCYRGDASQRSTAVRLLRGWQKEQPRVIKSLKKLAESGPSEFRLKALATLISFSKDPKLALPALTSALKSKDVRLRLVALQSVRKTKMISAEFARLAARAFEVDELRAEAVKTLGGFGTKTKDAVPTLTKFLKTADEDLLRAAVTALGKIGPPAAAAVAQLSKLGKTAKGALKSQVKRAIQKIDSKKRA